MIMVATLILKQPYNKYTKYGNIKINLSARLSVIPSVEVTSYPLYTSCNSPLRVGGARRAECVGVQITFLHMVDSFVHFSN